MRLHTQSAVMMKMLAMTLCLHFFWDSQCLAQVWFAELSGNNWSYTGIDTLAGSGNSLVFDASGNPHITYAVYDQTLSSSILRYATRASGTWTTRTLENLGSPPAQHQPGPPPIPTSLAINPVTMRPNVFYLTQANATPTSYRYGEVTPDGFVSEPVDSAGRTGTWYPSEGNYASLAIDSTGKPHVAYWKLESSGRSDLLYAARNGSAWSSSTVAAGRVFFSSLALNSDQTPGIAFYQETVAGSQGDLYFASLTNSGWQSEFVDGNTSGQYFGYQPSLAFGSDNMPRIAYTDFHGGLIKYAVQTGTSWEKQSIASTAQGNTQAFSSLIVTATSALNLFTDLISPPQFTQYLSTRTEAGWSSASLAPASSGAWNSLALNASNQPAFVFSYAVAVPEPSTCFSLTAGLAFGGCYVLKGRRRRSASGISRSIVAVLLATCSNMSGTTHAQLAIDWVTVGDPGNTADTTGRPNPAGAVATSFQIMKYEFTNQQYTAFLNSVDANGTNPNSVYNANMGSNARGGVSFTSGNASGSKYAAKTNMGDKPVNWVSWWDAARVSNWLMNGATGTSSMETGAYTLNNATSSTAPAVNPGATYFLPTEDQWYKAAYYKGGSTNAGYWDYATQSDTAPTAVTSGTTGIGSAGSTGNSANYNHAADWNGQNGNVTTVGTNGRASAYGAFDMSGNVWELNDLTGAAGFIRGIRGGDWSVLRASDLSSSAGGPDDPSFESVDNGFRLAAPVPEPSTCVMALAGLACGGYTMWRRRKLAGSRRLLLLCAVIAIAAGRSSTPTLAQSVNYEVVPVGDAGNAADTTGYGAVAYDYQIGKYDVTIGQYTAFLNAVAATDTYSLYNASMASDLAVAGISRAGFAGSYTYSVINNGGDSANRPITYVSWWDSARFANWMANGQPTGAQNSTTTENGAYNVNGATSGNAPTKNVMNPNTGTAPTFFIPTENEWYKAAYYSPALNGGTGGYYRYATQSNTPPGNTIGSLVNQANYYNGVYCVTQSSTTSPDQNYLTDVGAFTNSASYYGTFDQSGNVCQWNDLDGIVADVRGLRGGYWDDGSNYVSSSIRFTFATGLEYSPIFGFRLAAPAAVPEPSALFSLAAGLAFGGWHVLKRRRRRVASVISRSIAALLGATCSVMTIPALAVNYEMVTVGDVGNVADTTGYGAVAYDYQIGKYDVTIGQYTAFLNAVAATDTYSLYKASMGTVKNSRGISRTGVSGSYSYSVIGPDGVVNGQSGANRPITYVSWFDSARFANWMANGQPTGAQTNATTENGAYNLNGATSGTAPAKNVMNPNTSAAPTYVIPTENEWYKAAYYSPVLNSGSGGYYTYATQSNADPGNQIGTGSNQANYARGRVFSVTQSASYSSSQNYLTDVGAFTNSASFYGAFDQSGNVYQWNDLDGTPGSSRGLRGGNWDGFGAFNLSSSGRNTPDPSLENIYFGFRLASPVVVPEPSTWVMGLAGLACGGWQVFRRRRAR